ncbi:hypothetical protein FRC12_005530 [Ceratobasidium sp. 428]|nr:hypothetical protein FRC12_005530 [Ceratobasidium sp. 428]
MNHRFPLISLGRVNMDPDVSRSMATPGTSSTPPTAAFSLPRTCNACGSSGIFRCASCFYIWYCSPECQLRDQESHIELCPLFSGQSSTSSFRTAQDLNGSGSIQVSHPLSAPPLASTNTLGSPNTGQRVQAVILPSNSPQYYYASIELRSYSGPLRTVRWLPRLSHIFGDNVTPPDTVATKGMAGRRLRFPLHFFFQVPPDTMPRVTHLQRNEAVYTMAGETPHPWKGNIVVLKYNGGQKRGYQDVEDSDLRAIAHFLLQKRSGSPSSEPVQCFPYYTWRG